MSSSSACRFFQSPQGCFRGASCTFRHDGEAATSDVLLSAANPYANGSIPAPTQPRTCHFFASDSGCRNGTNCPFMHVAAETSGPEAPEFAAYDELAAPPLPQDFPVAVASGGAVFYNHPGLPPPMMMVAPEPDDENAATVVAKPKRKLQIQANPQKKETISEILPVLTRDIEGPFFAIDVECVATGNGTNDRDVARIAVVDEDEKVVFDQYVKPTKPIVSYLTQLTGITESNLKDAPDLKEALVRLKAILPVESVIVGQSIKKDLEWLTLQKPTDYKGEFDVADLFRLPMQSTNGVVRYRYFSLRHVAKYLLGQDIQEADHDPVIDARYAMKVFKKFRHLHENPGRRDAVLQTLLKTPRTPSFAERYPVIDGVSMRAPRKRSTSPSIRNANRVAAEQAQHATNGGYNLRYQQQQHGQQPLYL
ncbi:hypothetical protein F441_16920 [Phytophthora nicotianae CJ01A1]|uniref:C3H1-type domain-containing protein n=6 Tax=Phytophthora nicotianae TaxID=4792 RepID=W2PN99_PHYN3|nr:hypothetical protein PPTG_16562 [Phytophthora nicotianae INRA-310]ETI36963.1 hypothetical protein F443_17061 [Phytophthora nicotianae P1569]ETK77156.1 hypothetical protein L915_16590 [Phytophthora nicotianae]ETO65673.1 hypothetical protein F444_17093 [Phytophthora nicotianae P1976]ETP06788.1 hypothetical protein F441_16920 [Phytophthora nicotianae CJ01A1]ETP34823.1 hypothetical protein F442_16919 [Phytophthora nicotianae P10297]